MKVMTTPPDAAGFDPIKDIKVMEADRSDRWRHAIDRPLDFDGPTDVPFERFDDNPVGCSITSRFRAIARRYPTKIAIDDGEMRLTYAEAWRITSLLAPRIANLAPAGRPVAIVLPNSSLFPVAALACLASGRPYVPIDLDYPPARNSEILSEARAAAAITRKGVPAASAFIPACMPSIDVTELISTAEASPLDIADVKAGTAILFTSGSTRRPKGICNDEAALLQRIAQYTNACHLRADDRFILLSSPSTIAGVRDTFTALLLGATLYIAELQRIGIWGVQRLIQDERITVYYSVPAVLRSLLNGAGAKAAVATLRIVRLGGDTTLESDLALFQAVLPPNCHVLVGFGSTEAPTIFQWFARPGMGDGLRVPSGFAVPEVTFALIDENGTPVLENEIGELVVRSRYLALGLWQEGRLVPGPIESDPTESDLRILRTGDLFRLRGDGMAEPHGRNDRQVKIRGLRVDPGEVEAALRRCDGVADAAVVARCKDSVDVALVGFVVPQPRSSRLTSSNVQRAVSAWLPPTKCPAIIHMIEEVPRLPSFKPDLAALGALDLARRSVEDAAKFRDAAPVPITGASRIRDAVQRAWAEVCGARSLTRDQAWEEAGGDSLKALQMLLDIEERLGCRLSTDVLSLGMTPAALCAAVERSVDQPRECDPRQAREEGRPTVFLMPGIFYDELDLAQFRVALRDRVRFVLIHYPNWREAIAGGAGLETIVTSAIKQVLSQTGDGPIRLAGYSFGGFVAYETACELASAGRQVGFLGLLDTRRRSQFANQPLLEYVRRRDVALFLRLAFRVLLRLRAFTLLKAFARLCISAGVPRAEISLLYVLRAHAVRRWHPTPLSIPTFFFRSADHRHDQPYDYGWAKLCSQLSVVPIEGDHSSMLAVAHRQRLCAALLEALRVADASASSLAPADI